MPQRMQVPRFDTAGVLVVGDAMLERYWQGRTDRISAEAPIPVVEVAEVEDRPGAAANVALNVATLGAGARLVAAVGDDEPGVALRNKLIAGGITADLLVTPRRTTAKYRIVSLNQQLIRADFEDIEPVPVADVLAKVRQHINEVDSVLLSDYDKGLLADPAPVVALAREHGRPVLVDPKFKHFGAYRGATVIKPNLKELRHAIGDWDSEVAMLELCRQLIASIEIEALLVTRASEGMTLIRREGDAVHFPARTREVYDVSGAGDTVIATMTAALASGATMTDATALANIAAGVVVGYFGITSVAGPELRAAVAEEERDDKREVRGIVSEDQLASAVAEAKAAGRRVVFTNGCFDVLHAGHVTYLEDARDAGDFLVVAVNGDDSVTRLKGEGRPINPVQHRMMLLSGLTAVDWVTSFVDDTAERLLERIQPDVLVKGGDYSVDEVVGADIVRRYGGDVRVLALVDDLSTTSIAEKIKTL